MIESGYRTVANAYSRAIARMSIGGECALPVGFGHPELFRSNPSCRSFHAG